MDPDAFLRQLMSQLVGQPTLIYTEGETDLGRVASWLTTIDEVGVAKGSAVFLGKAGTSAAESCTRHKTHLSKDGAWLYIL